MPADDGGRQRERFVVPPLDPSDHVHDPPHTGRGTYQTHVLRRHSYATLRNQNTDSDTVRLRSRSMQSVSWLAVNGEQATELVQNVALVQTPVATARSPKRRR
jgi:hypothetical protein